MAAGTFNIYDSAKLRIGRGELNLSQTFFVCVTHSASYTPNIDDSDYGGSISAGVLLLSGNDAVRQVGTGVGLWTKTAAGVMKFDLSDVNLTASSGVNLSAKYCVLLADNGAAATTSYVPVGYFELSVGSSVVASQINITWPAAGVFETSDNV